MNEHNNGNGSTQQNDQHDAEHLPPEADGAELTDSDRPGVSAFDLDGMTGDAGKSAGDDVMDILAGVEEQFKKLRDVRETQQGELASLAQRSEALAESEAQLEREMDQLVEQQKSLQQARGELDDRDAAARELQEKLAAEQASLSQARADIEQQQQRIAEQKRSLAAERAEVDELQHATLERDEASQQRSAELEQKSESLAQRQHELDQRVASMDEIESDLEQRDAAIAMREQQVDAVQQEIKADRARIAEQEAALVAEREKLAEQQQELESQRAEFAERTQEAEAETEKLRGQVESATAEVKHTTEKLQAAGEEAAELRSTIEALQNTLTQTKAAAEQSETEALALAAEAEQQRDELKLKCEALAGDQEHAQQELAESREKLAAAKSAEQRASTEAAERDEQITSLKLQLEQKEVALADVERKLSIAGDKLKEFALALADQTPQLERGAAAMATVEQQKQQIERLTKELAAAKRTGNPEELGRKEERIKELTEALRQTRGQNGGDADISAMQESISTLSADNDRLRDELEAASLAAREAQSQLEQVATEKSSESPRIEEYERRNEMLQSELDRVTQDLESAESKLVEQAASGSEIDQASKEEIDALQQRIAELEQQVEQAQSLAADSADNEQVEKMLEDVHHKTERINTVAKHLQQRKKRLSRWRRLLKQQGGSRKSDTKSAADTERRAKQMREFDQQRQQLIEIRDMLALSEQRMVNRWARSRAMITTGWFVFLLAFAAAASWFSANIFYPQEAAATMSFEPAPDQSIQNPLTKSQAQEWQQWHAEILQSDPFLRMMARRCADRRINEYSQPQQVKSLLQENLSIDTSDAGLLTLTLAGTNGERTREMLDMVASTLVLESNRLIEKRAEKIRLAPLKQWKEGSRISYADLSATPMTAERWQKMGFIFGGVFSGLLLIVGGMWFRLARSKRIFDDENPLFSGDLPTGMAA